MFTNTKATYKGPAGGTVHFGDYHEPVLLETKRDYMPWLFSLFGWIAALGLAVLR